MDIEKIPNTDEYIKKEFTRIQSGTNYSNLRPKLQVLKGYSLRTYEYLFNIYC